MKDHEEQTAGSRGRVPDDRLRVAYLLWRYPEVSLTFVQREVAALRARGVEVHTLSIRPPHPETLLTETERESARTSWSILPARPVEVLLAHLTALSTRPAAWAAALRLAVGAGPLPARLKGVLYFAEAVVLARHLRRLGVDHLHVHGGDVSSTVAMIVARLERSGPRPRRFTWSLTVHGPGEFLDPAGHRLLEKTAAADLVVAISEYGRSQFLALLDDSHWSKVAVVHCGIDLTRWADRSEPREHLDRLRVLSVGRLHPQKAHEVLVQAVGVLRDRGVDVALTVVGEGPTRARLEQLVARAHLADRVHLTGALGQDDVPAQFRAHDVFALASVSEGLPVVLMEAMAAGLPVVTTRITGVPELVVDGVTGLLVPPARPELLADALQRLAADAGLRDRLRQAGTAAVRSGFDVRQTSRELEQLFRDVVDVRPTVRADVS